MNTRELGYLQVAALLVSASYGVGFLFGAGELAVTSGMAGSLYPWLTALGMALLAILAGKVWSLRAPIWDMFGRAYGPTVRRQVALLSLIWMTGVLAAQIQGGAAVLLLAALPRQAVLPSMLVLIFGATQLNLRAASKVFSFCLLASSFVLVFALREMNGGDVYLHAIPRFLRDVHRMSGRDVIAMTVAVVFLVITGADYQQFIIAARRRIDAIAGCGLAAVFLLLVGALPASAVIAAQNTGVLAGAATSKLAIPTILSHVSAHLGQGYSVAMLLALLAAALGAGAAIVRAMTGALASVIPAATTTRVEGARMSAAIVLFGGMVAQRGQGIVETMVELNVVYIASVAPLFAFLLIGWPVSPAAAQRAITAGLVASVCLYIGKWIGLVSGQVELMFLSVGMLASLVVLALSRRKTATIV